MSEETKTSLDAFKRMFQDSQDLNGDARTEALADIDYYDSDQWTDAEKATLAQRKQPVITINRIKPAVNGILGVVERGKSDPRAYPRTPKDEQSAEVATDTLRFICDFNRWSRIKVEAFTDMLVPGTMAAIIEVDEDRQIITRQIRWEEFFADPRSRKRDFSDARYMGIAKWMYADDVAAIYPDKRDDVESAVNNGLGVTIDQTFEDRPDRNTGSWIDKRLRRVLVVEIYVREVGKWSRCVFFGGGVLEHGESPYQDQKGRPTCPIEAQSAYVKRDNSRYGIVRDMRGPQDEVNHRRSKLLHLLNSRQLQENPNSPTGVMDVDADVARKEAARPDGVLPAGYMVVPTSDMSMGNAELLREAKSEIERMGPNPAILGRESTDASGRALLARQQSGLVELAILFGGLEDWELRVLRQCWARAKQFWTEPQYLRVTDDEGAAKFVMVNEPVMGMQQVPLMDPITQRPIVNPMTGQPVMQEQQAVLGYRNRLAEMDVDIILDTTPDTANVQQEQFQDLMQLVAANPAYAQQVPFEMLLQLSAIPHKKDLVDQIKANREQAMQAQAQQQQEMQQIAKAGAAAKIEVDQSTATKNRAAAARDMADARNTVMQGAFNAMEPMQPAAAGL